jgi:hypothetical protein
MDLLRRAQSLRTSAALAMAMLGLAACGRGGGPPSTPALLDAAGQRTAAEKIARSFAEGCLASADALSATRALQTQGWPPFNVVWDQPDSIFYAAKPSPASPAGLFVVGDRSRPGARRLTCVGHYLAEGIGPMIQALERRWGPSRPGPASLPGSHIWSFRMKGGGELTAAGPGLPPSDPALAPGETLVYAQVSYNQPYRDVASLVTVWR